MSVRTTSEKLTIYKSLFVGLTEVYGTYDPQTGKARQVKKPVTDKVLLSHFRGVQPYGIYLLRRDKTSALAVDFDCDQVCYPLIFHAEAWRYGVFTYIERSKSKGYHVWVFFPEGGVPANKARLVASGILALMGQPNTEIFPKQDVLDEHTSYGNFINAPLFGALVHKGRTVFVHPSKPRQPYPDQWELLAGVRRVEEATLDTFIQSKGLSPPPCHNGQEHRLETVSDPTGSQRSFGLPPCAQRMLEEGVPDQQRVRCFRLSIHLKRAGIPYDLAVKLLHAWAQKNRPQGGKRIITSEEINDQARDAYEKPYRSCGCEDAAVTPYCDERCPLYASRKSESP